MRILKGKDAGRQLTSPGGSVRPTAEAVRARALDLVTPELQGARFLDLFAGTGAVGLEALSRGARSADFVENSPSALHALKANVTALRVRNRSRIFKRDAIPWIEAVGPDSYDIAYLDPPYGSRKLDRVVAYWIEVPFAPVLLLEHHTDHELPVRGRSWTFEGSTRITLLRSTAGSGPPSE